VTKEQSIHCLSGSFFPSPVSFGDNPEVPPLPRNSAYEEKAPSQVTFLIPGARFRKAMSGILSTLLTQWDSEGDLCELISWKTGTRAQMSHIPPSQGDGGQVKIKFS
jgi:hypothetical protein